MQHPRQRQYQDRIQTYRLALLVFAPVQDSPVDLPGVPLGQEGRLALGIQKLEHLQESGVFSEQLKLHSQQC